MDIYLYRKITPLEETTLKCIICESLLQNPHQSVCGCRACHNCWTEYLNNEDFKSCPGRSKECSQVSFKNPSYLLRPDPGAKRDASKVFINCINRKGDSGCNKTMQMKSLAEHLTSECLYNEINCERCGQKIWQIELSEHRENHCQMELKKCNFCDKSFTRLDLESIHHNIASDGCCLLYRGPCKYCNYNLTGIEQVKKHKKECKSMKFPCEFKAIGCSYDGTRQELENHNIEEKKEHLKLASDSIANNGSTLNHYRGILDQINKETKKLSGSIEYCKDLTKTASDLIQNFRSDPTHYSEHHHMPASLVHKGGIFVWKITEVSMKREIAKSSSGPPHITSEAFYSSQFGYKMCARIYLNGDGQATGSYLSVFIVLMRGEYDDILNWPFGNKVTVSLLDQEGRNNDHSHTFRPDPQSECFMKPSSEFNTASGVPSFYSLNSLLENSRYLKNDTLYLRVRIHPNNS